MPQLGIPVEVTPQEVAREGTLGGAISLCAKAAGMVPKEVQDALKTDKAQFSRWTDDKEGITWAKLSALMDVCGNDAPLFWMLHARGYELATLKKRETEIEKQLRMVREELQREKQERAMERRIFTEIRAGVPA